MLLFQQGRVGKCTDRDSVGGQQVAHIWGAEAVPHNSKLRLLISELFFDGGCPSGDVVVGICGVFGAPSGKVEVRRERLFFGLAVDGEVVLIKSPISPFIQLNQKQSKATAEHTPRK